MSLVPGGRGRRAPTCRRSFCSGTVRRELQPGPGLADEKEKTKTENPPFQKSLEPGLYLGQKRLETEVQAQDQQDRGPV